MANLGAVLRDEIKRLAKREITASTASARKTVAQLRRDVAALKRQNASLEKKVAFLEGREKKRLTTPAPAGAAKGARFSTRSLQAQRRRTGLSQANYAKLVGVSTLTINNWENGKTKPGSKHLGALVAIRGLGKREAEKRLEVIEGA